MMTAADINLAAKEIASNLHTAGRQGRVTRVDIETIRAAVAGFAAAGAHFFTTEQRQQLEDLTLRKFVEACP